MVPQPTPIYHITDFSNLPSILSNGGLGSTCWLSDRGRLYTSIAYESIQDRRATTLVPCGPGGTLYNYVPFSFGARPPMLYTISRGNVPTYDRGQESVIHLVSTAQAVEATGCRFVFTDGHGIMALTDFFDDLARLDRVDWPPMRSKYWNDTPTDNDRKRRRQAEFLIHEFCSWGLIAEIGVMTPAIRDQVLHAIETAQHKPVVTVCQAWYYWAPC